MTEFSKKTVVVKTKLIIPKIVEFTGKKLELTELEISDKEALRDYINEYYLPIGFEVDTLSFK